MRLFLATLVLVPTVAVAQDAESLKARIQEHYAAIHAGNADVVISHHLPEMSIFTMNGELLMEPGWQETATRMGAEIPWPNANLTMRHFSAQVYDDVGVAIFYLHGSYGDTVGTWRVTAVWVWRDGEWKEAHHHESRLVS